MQLEKATYTDQKAALHKVPLRHLMFEKEFIPFFGEIIKQQHF